MQRAYCSNPSCGKVTLYEAAKPNLCGYCGNPFNAAFKTIQFQPTIAKTKSKYDGFQFKVAERPIEGDEGGAELQGEVKIKVSDNIPRKTTLGDYQRLGLGPEVDRPTGHELDQKAVFAKIESTRGKGRLDESTYQDIGGSE